MLENLRIAARKQKKLILIFFLTIFLPALTLGIFGVRAIRNERFRQVREEENEGRRAVRLVRGHFEAKFEGIARALDDLARNPAFAGKDFAAIHELTEERFATDPLVGQAVLLYRNAEPLFPRIFLPGGDRAADSPKSGGSPPDPRIGEAESIEFAGQNPRRAAALYREMAEEGADRNDRAELLARQARCLRKAGDYDDAVRIFDRIVREHPDSLTPSGMPLDLLARLQIVECRRLSGNLDGARSHALDAYRELVKKPSPLGEDRFKTYLSLAGEAAEALIEQEKDTPAAERFRKEFSDLKILGSARVKERAAAAILRMEIVPELESRLAREANPLQNPDRISRNVGGLDILLLAARIPGRTPGMSAGILGVQLDSDLLLRDVLSEALGSAEIADGKAIRLTDLADRPLSEKEIPAGASPLAAEYFRDNFPPWKIAAFRVAAQKPEGLDLRRNFFFWTILTLLVVLAFGAFLIARTIAREMEILKIKSDFVSSVSHEFKTPLTSIKALMERLIEGKVRDPEKMDRYFAIIAQDTDKLARLVNNLLDFTKIEEGRKEYVFAGTDLARIAADEVERFNKERAIAEPPIRLEIAGEIPILRADADALSRALANLLSNAVKFTPPEKSIRVRLAAEGTSVVLDVEDEGIGIPPDETAKVFEKFYQGRNALTQSAKGTGLGLTLVMHIVEAHGGRILVESRLGQGSKFSVILPTPS